ncbi:MAG TPA: hypothetical protein VK841_02845, partial [Polyangiaceae bacterium]|nr:hypothetical protein [Polyangiaceae bacterium]
MVHIRRKIVWLAAIAAAAGGCSNSGDDDGGGSPDATADGSSGADAASGPGTDATGGPDGAVSDGASPDGARNEPPDGSDAASPPVEDATSPDGGAMDAALVDTGAVDSGGGSTGALDGGAPDGGSAHSVADAGAGADAGVPDGAADAAVGPLCGGHCAAGDVLCGGFCYPAGTGCPACNADACSQNGKATCNAQGQCQVVSCNPGWQDCDGDPTNGCEADLTSAATCGTCGNACSGGTPLCSSGSCVASCTVPLANCGTGRCVDRSDDPNHCGTCSTVCPASAGNVATCSSGSCGTAAPTCPQGETLCNGACLADMTSDPNNCGSCGHACPSGNAGAPAVCAHSQCITGCPAGFSLCGTTCVVTSADVNNCGSCGNACASGDVCQQGACATPSRLLLVTGQGTPDAIALDDDHVYWMDTSATSISSVPKAGGAVTTILAQNATEPFFLGQGGDANLYFQTGGSSGPVLRVLRDGTAAVQTFLATPPGSLIGVDATNLYFDVPGVYPTPESIVTIPVAGGASSPDFSYGLGLSVLHQVVVDGQVFAVVLNGGSGAQIFNDAVDELEVHGSDTISGAGSCAYYPEDIATGSAGFTPIGSTPVGSATCASGASLSNAIGSACGLLAFGAPLSAPNM